MIYLDNAATTLIKPPAVIQAVTQALSALGNPGRGVHAGALDAARVVYEARSALAELFHAEQPSCIAFTLNATQALNTAIKGILRPGDHVITTALEHNSVLRPLYEMEERGVQVTILPADSRGCIRYEDFEAAIQKNTRAIICTHASNLTGNLLDIGRIGRIAKKHDLLFAVDASQSAGAMDIDVQKMQIDILCFTGHKALMGPQGTGGLVVRTGVSVQPLVTGGSGVQSHSRSHPLQMPTVLEAGTLNAHGIAGLNAAVKYLRQLGLDAVRRKEQALMQRFLAGVSDIPGVTLYGDFSAAERCPIVTLNLWDWDSALVSDALSERFGIATRPGAHCAPLMHQALGTVQQGAVRFSFSHLNTEEEIDTAVAALRQLAMEE